MQDYPVNPDLISSTHIQQLTTIQLQLQGIQDPLWTPWVLYTCPHVGYHTDYAAIYIT